MDPPLTSTELRAFEPVLRMGCATNMIAFYNEKNTKHHSPYMDSFELLKCYSKCWEDMNRTEEAKKLFDDYQGCIKKNPDDYIKCKPLRTSLEEVTVKHRFGEIPLVEKAHQTYNEYKACIKGKPKEEHHLCQHIIPKTEVENLHYVVVASTAEFFDSLELPSKEELPKRTWYDVLQHP